MRGLATRNPAAAWLSAGVAVVVAFLLFGVLATAISPTPSGPALSSYATTPAGLAAWAELLRRDGHPVYQLRAAWTDRYPPARATVVAMYEIDSLSTLVHAVQAQLPNSPLVERFLRRGGRLVLGGEAAAFASFAHGDVVSVDDPAFLENARLAQGDNALRALRLAGAPGRPVYFDEAIHGYGPATGLSALPERWWLALAALTLALLSWAASRALRPGGADPAPPVPPSPRAAYIEAMARNLARTGGGQAALSAELERAREQEAASASPVKI